MDAKVSILCPLYNKKQYVMETLNSVLAQTYTNWEFIIVDDGSTDGCYEMVEQKIAELGMPNIQLYKRSDISQNKGASVCRNIGISKSTGNYAIFLDADDVLKENCLQTRLHAVEKHSGYGFYIFNVVQFKNNIGNLTPRSTKYKIDKVRFSLTGDQRKYFIKRFLTYDSPWSICNTFWRMESLQKIGGFNESFQRLQDPEIHTRALLRDDISFKILKYELPPDVYVRIDDDRKANFSNVEIFNNVFLSIRHFVNFFTGYLQQHNKSEYLKYLSAYFFLVEQMYVGYIRKASPDELKVYNEKYNELKSNENASKVLNGRYMRFNKAYKTLNSIKFARKLRLHSLLVYFYKLTV